MFGVIQSVADFHGQSAVSDVNTPHTGISAAQPARRPLFIIEQSPTVPGQ